MSQAAALSDPSLRHRALVLAPLGLEAASAVGLLAEAGIDGHPCAHLDELIDELERGAALAVIAHEAVRSADLSGLSAWIASQPAWSDLPLIVVTERDSSPERSPAALRLMETLGNLTVLERPFRPATLASVAGTALRSRRRQYEAADRLEALAQREQALGESDARFRMLAVNIPVLAWMAYADGSIFWYNPRWFEYTGTNAKQMEGWGWRSVHDPRALPGVMTRWQECLRAGAAFEMVFPLRGADGVFRPFLTRVAPVRDEAGHIVRWLGTNADISAEHEAKAAARACEERAHLAMEASELGSWELDLVTGAAKCCTKHYRIFGYSDDRVEWSFEAFLDHVLPQDRADVQAGFHRALEANAAWNFECRIERRNDGRIRWVDGHTRLSDATLGKPATLIGVLADITARKESQRLLASAKAAAEEIVEERTRELLSANERLLREAEAREHLEQALRQNQKMEAVGQLTGGIAHDFNNLLTGIIGSLELMQNRLADGRTDGLERYAAAATLAAQRAASLTQRLLAFSRRQPLDPRRVEANRLLAGMGDVLRRTLSPSVELEMVLPGGLWSTLCDPGQLENAVLNMAINARDAMPDGGRLTVETENFDLDKSSAADQGGEMRAGQYVVVSLTDTGTGMPPEVAARAFEPFFTTKPLGQGTGLGLSMVYGFARQSGGTVRIMSQAGQGASFRLYLPRQGGSAVPRAEGAAASPAGNTAEQGDEVILVVDDEPTIRMLIVETLEKLGYVVLEAGDGPSGLAVLESDTRIDLLLTDVGLPGLNGRQIADAGLMSRPGLPVLFMTGYAHNAAVGNGAALAPGMQIISKPFSLDDLSRKIRNILSDPPEKSAEIAISESVEVGSRGGL